MDNKPFVPPKGLKSAGITGDQSTVAPTVTAVSVTTVSSGGTTTTTASTTATTAGGEEWKAVSIPVPDVSGAVGALSTVTKTMDKVMTIVNPILSIIELVLNCFSSIAKLLAGLIGQIQTMVNKIVGQGVGAGVYLNLLVPPALLKEAGGDTNLAHLNSGGFQAFLSRLQAACVDPTDPSRPTFGKEGVVGGLIIIADSESYDEFFLAVKQLASLFDFMKIFGIETSPPAPANLRAYPGMYKKNGVYEYGVVLKWDAPPGFVFSYSLSCSLNRGGLLKPAVPITPTSLIGEDGLFPLVKNMFTQQNFKWPTRDEYVYDALGTPVVVFPDLVNGGGSYYMSLAQFTDPPAKAGGYPTKKATAPQQLFFVVQSIVNTGLIIVDSPKSNEVAFTLKTCDDSATTVDIVEHADGSFETLAPGMARLGRWSTVSASVMIPQVTEIVDVMNKFLDQLRGGLTDASDSFSSFIDEIKNKITMYTDMVDALTKVIEQLKSFSLGPSTALLFVPPEKGGTNGFIQRVKDATIPLRTVKVPVYDANGQPLKDPVTGAMVTEDKQIGFSGPKGMTAGIVLMYGIGGTADNADAIANKNAAVQAAEKAAFEVTDKTFKAILKLLGVNNV
jgi:hypothetical protein